MVIGKLTPRDRLAASRSECVAKAGRVADAAERGHAVLGEKLERLRFAARVD